MSFLPNNPDQVNAANSSTTPLAANAVFQGTTVDCTAQFISSIMVFAWSDVASATGGFKLQWSQDNVNWGDHDQTDTAVANTSSIISDKIRARYFRVQYTNGGTEQTKFRLQTLISSTNTSGTVRDLDTIISGDDEAQLVRSIITGIATLGTPPNLTTGKYTQVVTDVYGSQQVVIGGQAADAFGRMRIGNPVGLFDAQFQYDTQPLLFQTQAVGGSVAKTTGESSLTLSTGGTTIYNFAVNQTKSYFRYQPGKSQQILMTGILGSQTSNVRSEIGYFDANDGVFFRQDGAVGMCVVERSSIPGVSVGAIPAIAIAVGGASYTAGDTGTISTGGANATYKVLAVTGGVVTAIALTGAGTGYTTGLGVATATGGGQPGSGTGLTVNMLNETVIQQSSWNFDKLDGTGLSGITLDPSKGQVFVIDFQWLGVGRVRFGFFINGALIVCHQIFNANNVASPYMNTANLPCRASIKNTGTASGTTTMKQICLTAVSEGGSEYPQAYQFAASNADTLIPGIGVTRVPLISLRLKTTAAPFGTGVLTNRSKINVVDFDVFDNSSPGGYWELVYNGTLSGSPSFASVDNNSGVTFDVAATGCTGGTVIASGYVAGGGKATATVAVDSKLPLALDILGTTPDTLSLCIRSTGTNIAAAGAIRWQEIR